MGDIGDSDRDRGWLRWEGEVRGKRGKVGAWLEVNCLFLVADNDVVEGRRCYNFQEEYVTSLDQQLDLNVIIPVCLWLKYYKKVEQFTTVNCVFVVNCLQNSVRAIWLHLTVWYPWNFQTFSFHGNLDLPINLHADYILCSQGWIGKGLTTKLVL